MQNPQQNFNSIRVKTHSKFIFKAVFVLNSNVLLRDRYACKGEEIGVVLLVGIEITLEFEVKSHVS